MTNIDIIIGPAYLLAAILFILGIKRLTSPATARSGNRLAGIAMAIALGVTLLNGDIFPAITALKLIPLASIVVGTLIGAGIGIYFAKTVKMTAMPQMVALFNGMGGATAALVSIAEFTRAVGETGTGGGAGQVVSIVLGTIIGSISFSGSIIAFMKLQEMMTDRPLRFGGQTYFNGLLLLAALALGGYLLVGPSPAYLWGVFGLAALLGVTAVLPIGGADMPVVISLLNSFTGCAAALTGFVVQNQILIVAGALVGASGMLLTLLMSKAMNRPISNVLFSGFGAVQAGGNGKGPAVAKIVKEASAEDVGVALAFARNVVIVPGYGLAVAQAQHTVRELAEELEKHGVTVKYAIHPVAGRMPGHMNVLLAEANVPYDQLAEMEQINGEFDNTDVSLVIGANDVVNPAARSDPASPIYGMPILDVDHSRNVVVMKRSMNPGFAGIDNELFYSHTTRVAAVTAVFLEGNGAGGGAAPPPALGMNVSVQQSGAPVVDLSVARAAHPTSGVPALQLDGIARRFNRRWVLRGISLRVEPGEAIALMGRNGSGKTTLLRIVSTALSPTRGSGQVFGHDLQKDGGSVRELVGVLGHAAGLYEDLTALENLRFALRMAGLPAHKEQIRQALAAVRLAAEENERVRNFSAGMRRRLGLAKLLMRPPRLLLLDEPYAAFDADGIDLVNGFVRETVNAGGAAIVSTHDLARALPVVGRIVRIVDGVAVDGAPEDDPDTDEASPTAGRLTVEEGGLR